MYFSLSVFLSLSITLFDFVRPFVLSLVLYVCMSF